MKNTSQIANALYPKRGESESTRFSLFSLLGDEHLEILKKMTRVKTVKRRQPIYLPGDTSDKVYLLKSGRVKISRVTEDGKEFTLVILEPGEVFGELEVLEGTPRDTMAEGIDDVELLVMDRVGFQRILRMNPDLMFEWTKHIGNRLKKIESRIEDLVFRDVPTRLAKLLMEFSTEFGEPSGDGTRLRFRITHQELASLIGSTRETVSATLNNFKRQGIILQDHRWITIRHHERFAMIQ